MGALAFRGIVVAAVDGGAIFCNLGSHRVRRRFVDGLQQRSMQSMDAFFTQTVGIVAIRRRLSARHRA